MEFWKFNTLSCCLNHCDWTTEQRGTAAAGCIKQRAQRRLSSSGILQTRWKSSEMAEGEVFIQYKAEKAEGSEKYIKPQSYNSK